MYFEDCLEIVLGEDEIEIVVVVLVFSKDDVDKVEIYDVEFKIVCSCSGIIMCFGMGVRNFV